MIPIIQAPRNGQTRLDSFARKFNRFIEDNDGFLGQTPNNVMLLEVYVK